MMFVKYVLLGVLLFGGATAVAAQDKAIGSSVSGLSGTTREQDGLLGPVRRVRVEMAKVLVKGGRMSESGRVLRETATYDPKGKKIDSIAYPVESATTPGKEQYQYDDKGNIIEMVSRADDGSILSKEKYDYEFDEFGNWRKMITSIAVYENGQVSYEPVEITYRTIAYYYGEAVAKLTKTTSAPAGSTQPATSIVPVKKDLETNKTALQPANEKPEKSAESSVGETKNDTNSASETAATNNSEVSKKPNPTLPVIHVSEENLRKAAVELPEAEYPKEAALSRLEGTVVVQLLINESGSVENTRTVSGNSLLGAKAEEAARRARFAVTKLASQPAKVFGVISYHFTAPSIKAEEAPTSGPTAAAVKSGKPAETRPATTLPAETAEQPRSTSEVSFYKQGMSYLAVGRIEDAIEAFKRAIDADPNDVHSYIRLGISYSALEQHKEAVAVFKMALRIKREAVDAEAQYRLGQSYLGLSKTKEAVDAFKQSLYLRRAEILGIETKPTEEFPSLAEIHHALGLAFYNMGRFTDSIKELKEVIALEAGNAEAHFGLAMAYLAMGDRKGAEKEQQVLVNLDAELASKLTAILLSGKIVPPGFTQGILRSRP